MGEWLQRKTLPSPWCLVPPRPCLIPCASPPLPHSVCCLTPCASPPLPHPVCLSPLIAACLLPDPCLLACLSPACLSPACLTPGACLPKSPACQTPGACLPEPCLCPTPGACLPAAVYVCADEVVCGSVQGREHHHHHRPHPRQAGAQAHSQGVCGEHEARCAGCLL